MNLKLTNTETEPVDVQLSLDEGKTTYQRSILPSEGWMEVEIPYVPSKIEIDCTRISDYSRPRDEEIERLRAAIQQAVDVLSNHKHSTSWRIAAVSSALQGALLGFNHKIDDR